MLRQPQRQTVKADEITTRDLGLFIRDMIEYREFFHFIDDEQTSTLSHVDSVDVSDPNNLRIGCSTGERFTCRILRTA